MSTQFTSPAECVTATQERLAEIRYGDGERPGEEQSFCDRCRLWKYADERCNLFEVGNQLVSSNG